MESRDLVDQVEVLDGLPLGAMAFEETVTSAWGDGHETQHYRGLDTSRPLLVKA